MRDWSALPGELLCLVSDGLGLVDFVRFAAVCVPWRVAVAGRRHHPPLRPQSPWLMSVPCSGAEPTAADFFCLADKTSYRLELPEPPVRRRMLIGSAGGWLVTADEVSEMHMLNPLTGVQIPLPSILTLPTVGALRDADGRLTGYLFKFDRMGASPAAPLGLEVTSAYVYRKVVLSTVTSSSDWTAALVFNPGRRVAFARAGDRAWTVLYDEYGVDDVMYHKERLYVMHYLPGTTMAWDLAAPFPRPERIGPPLDGNLGESGVSRYLRGYLIGVSRYLVESGGDLLQVWRKRSYVKGFIPTTLGFVVLRLDEREQKWVGVQSLGEQALFLGLNNSMSLSTLEYPELKRSSIYFMNDSLPLTSALAHGEEGEFCDIGVFNLEDDSVEPCCPHNNRLNWPTPIWIMPRLF